MFQFVESQSRSERTETQLSRDSFFILFNTIIIQSNLREDPPNKSVLTERSCSWNHSSDLEYTFSFWGVCPAHKIWTHHRLGAEMNVTEHGNDESGAILETVVMNRPSGDEWRSQPAGPVGQGGATAARTPGTGSPKQRLFSGGIRQPLRSSGLRWQSASAHPVRSAWGPGRDYRQRG